ncbi:MAG: hypothetical protein U5J83_01020 [Bryobacterales bacterium]|nr:hypothetical protein [Bryobacterales bacterium]
MRFAIRSARVLLLFLIWFALFSDAETAFVAAWAQSPAAATKPPSVAKIPPAPSAESVPPPATAPAEATAETEEAEPLLETEETEAPEPAPVPRGSALSRQAASVQKQIRRSRMPGGFFISTWFTDAPPSGSFASPSAIQAASAETSAPENCQPLDATIAEAYIRDSAKREGVSSDFLIAHGRGSRFNLVRCRQGDGMMQSPPPPPAPPLGSSAHRLRRTSTAGGGGRRNGC